MLQAGQLHCGPSGWSQEEWHPLAQTRGRQRTPQALETLVQHFDSVEVGRSFLEMPRPEISRLWLKQVQANPQFQFTAKLHRQFTHERQLDRAAVETFKEGYQPLLKADRLGALLMQFPWSFRFTAENRDFLIKLRRTFSEFPLVAEMRHASWMREEALGTFIDYRIGFCNIDQPQYVKSMPPTGYLTSPIAYVRLHGRNCFRWFMEFDDREQQHRYDYLYSPAELEEWQPRIERLRQHAETTFVMFNNDADSKAVVNALQMQALLGVSKGEAPEALVQRYPEQLTDLVMQQPLFTEFAAA